VCKEALLEAGKSKEAPWEIPSPIPMGEGEMAVNQLRSCCLYRG
jgi:hypothetical protein